MYGKARPNQIIEVFNLLTNEKTEYDYISAAALALNLKNYNFYVFSKESKKAIKNIFKKIDICLII